MSGYSYTSEGTVNGVEYVTVLNETGDPVMYSMIREDAEREYPRDLLTVAQQAELGPDTDEATARDYPYVIADTYGIAERFATRAAAEYHLGEGFGALGLTVQEQPVPGLMSRRLDLP